MLSLSWSVGPHSPDYLAIYRLHFGNARYDPFDLGAKYRGRMLTTGFSRLYGNTLARLTGYLRPQHSTQRGDHRQGPTSMNLPEFPI